MSLETSTIRKPSVMGLDLGNKSTQVTVRKNGAVERRFKVTTKSKTMLAAFEKLERCRVILEVGGPSPWVSRLLFALGFEVVVVAPTLLVDMFKRRQKTDTCDADTLAWIVETVPVELLRPVIHRSEQAQRHRSLLILRDEMVKARTQLVNGVRGVLGSLGVELPACSTEGFCRRVAKVITGADLELVKPSLELIAGANHQIKAIEERIEAVTETHYPQTKVLRQVKGVGPLTSLAFVLTVGDPERFHRNRRVGSYLGLVPKKQQSGDRDPQLGITKAGDSYLRRLLVQSAQYILGPFGPDTDLRRVGLAISARGGKSSKKRAVIAVARRLAILLLTLLKTGEVYEPLRHAQRQATSASA